MIYTSNLSSLPNTKVELDAGVSLSAVWKRVHHPSLVSETKEILYLLSHRKLPVKERLFRIGLLVDPYCEICIEICQSQDAIVDFEHYFCSCQKVSLVWPSIRDILVVLARQNVTDSDLILLRFPKSRYENEMSWLVGSYVQHVWQLLNSEGVSMIDRGQLFGYLKYKYRVDQLGARKEFVESSLIEHLEKYSVS